MFVNISPSLTEFNESNSSLKYAALVKTVTYLGCLSVLAQVLVLVLPRLSSCIVVIYSTFCFIFVFVFVFVFHR